MDEPRPGAVIGLYELDHELGSGAFGTVWAARRRDDRRAVAIKFLRVSPEPSVARRFQREAAMLARLDHPHCIGLIEFGETPDGAHYLVTDLLRGETLATWKNPTRDLRDIVEVMIHVADALAYAHRNGVVHRDLKPDNVIADVQNGRPVARVLDFGLARLVGRQPNDITKTGVVLGTPGYMSPEQLTASPNVGPASDLYSLGAMLFELIDGHRPFQGPNMMATCMMQLTDETPPLQTAVPRKLAELVYRLLSKDPAARGTASGVLDVLRGLTSTPTDRPELGVLQDARTRRMMIVAVGVVVCVCIALAATFVAERAPERPPALRAPPRLPMAPAAPKVTARDTGPPLPQPDCIRPEKTGDVVLEAIIDLDDVSVLTHIPEGLPPGPAPAIVLLHPGGDSTPKKWLDVTGARKLASAEGYILIVPEVAPMHLRYEGTWRKPYVRAAARAAIDLAVQRLCIARDDVFAFGVGTGGEGLHELTCEYRGFAAVATAAVRARWTAPPCVPSQPVPNMSMSPLNDLSHPIAGGKGCVWPVLSLDEHEATLRKNHGCKNTSRQRVGEGPCERLDCETDLVLCRIDHGRPYTQSTRKCPNERPEFDYFGAAVEFFNGYRSADAEDGGDH